MSDIDTDVQRTALVWRAVMQLERQHYTKREIAATLRQVANSLDPDA